MMSLKERLGKNVRECEARLAELKMYQNLLEPFAQSFDELSIPPGVKLFDKGQYMYGDADNLRYAVQLYVSVTAMSALLPLLETLEDRFNAEFAAEDRTDGVRRFYLDCEELRIRLSIYATPDTDNESATCRKVLVGMDTETHTEQVPRYAIQCN